MTKEEFRDYVTANNCKFEPIDGINHTGRSVKIVNNKYNWAYFYFRLPIDESEMPDYIICDACEELHIPPPPEVECNNGDIDY
jgi:hypothetical protein